VVLVYTATVDLLGPTGTILALRYHLLEELAVDAAALNDRGEEHPRWSLSNRPHEDKIVIEGIGVIDSPTRVERHARLADYLLHEVVIGKDLYEERLELRTLEAVQLIVGSDESGC